MKKTILFLTALVMGLIASAQNLDSCSICGARIRDTVYLAVDKVTNEKKALCEACTKLRTECYLCGLPSKDKYEELPDGRILCARDVKNVVLDEGEAQRIWNDVKNTVERQLSRFMDFPNNVTIHPLDRVDLQTMFQVVGNDSTCPHVWGCTERQTNANNSINYKISLLRGLPPSVLKATCAHELTHTWVWENVSRERDKRMSPDAEEGFCELVAYLMCEAQGDKAQMSVIKSNAYTRGQFALFREAESQYGMNEIVEWMKYGVDPALSKADLSRVRKIEIPADETKRPAAAPVAFAPAAPAAPPETLTLKGIMWSARPSAVINDRTFMVNDENKMRLGTNSVSVRCLAIRQDAVVLQIGSSQQTLSLPKP